LAQKEQDIASLSVFAHKNPQGHINLQNLVKAKVIPGHGIASGKNHDPRFPQGTLRMQSPFLTTRGFDLSTFYQGTINIDISPYIFKLGTPSLHFPQVKWSDDLPPENFSFYPCIISESIEGNPYNALIYWPHPSTKPEFHQRDGVLELLSTKIPFISSGSSVIIRAQKRHILFDSTG
jgi:hypothetical protein